MTGSVEANLTKTSFSVDQDKTKATGKEVLVLAPTLQKQADPNGYVTVIGQLIKFDEKEVAAKLKDYQIDLSPADIEKFKGKPVVLATAVINTSGIDIAKKPIPPMTADDLALQKIMTKLPPAQAAVRKSLDSKDAGRRQGTGDDAEGLLHGDRNVLQGQEQRGSDEVGRRGQGSRRIDPRQPGMNNIEAAKTSVTPLGGTCAIVPRQVSRTHGRRDVPDQDSRLTVQSSRFKSCN